jgi:predicted XRE-type DNA-binding protein
MDAEDMKVRASGGNVFADLGLPDADERLTKAELANEICCLIRSAKLTQTQAARRLGVDQPKVSALMRGQLKEFSIERLIRFATRLGRDVLIHLRSPERSGHASVRVLVET